ncbi:MAG: hypothetical protein JXR76_00060 [Deltaproteobacteria bacterium]|nr:hypothetical protein [Deltaproteobacteria bacterium]
MKWNTLDFFEAPNHSNRQPAASGLRSVTISFKSNRGRQVQRKKRRKRNLFRLYPVCAARLLALAHDIQHRVDTGEFHDYADVARRHNLTCARLTRSMNLLLLAPDIQDELLHMESERAAVDFRSEADEQSVKPEKYSRVDRAKRRQVGREPIGARDLRRRLVSLDWGEQKVIFRQIL